MRSALRRLCIAIGCVAVLYLMLVIVYWGASPKVTTDYVALAQSLQPVGPDEERSWPSIRDALQFLPGERGPSKDVNISAALTSRETDSPEWKTAEQAVTDYARAIAELRLAGARQRIGFRFQPPLDPADIAVMPQIQAPRVSPTPPSLEGSLLYLLLPYLTEYRTAARWLAADAVHAAVNRDGSRAAADIGGMVGYARQMLTPGAPMIQSLIGAAVLSQSRVTLQSLMYDWPDALSDSDLEVLARTYASISPLQFAMDFSLERMMFYDFVQRVYTDDGSGDGRLCGSGAISLQALSGLTTGQGASSLEQLADNLAGPVRALIAPSRRQMVRRFDSNMDHCQKLADTLCRDWAAQGLSGGARAEVDRMDSIDRVRWQLLWMLTPASDHAIVSLRRAQSEYDACGAAIAVERYRRQHGLLPATLDQLVPEFLAQPAPDPWDGMPLRIGSTKEGAVLIYSIDYDLTDDQGRVDLSNAARVSTDSRWGLPRGVPGVPGDLTDGGDFVLFGPTPTP